MKSEINEKKQMNGSRNFFDKKQYFTTFSNYNDFNNDNNKNKKIDKGISTILRYNFSNIDFNTLRLSQSNYDNKKKEINKILSPGTRKKYKCFFQPQNLKYMNFKYLNDNYINEMLDPNENLNNNIFLPSLTRENYDNKDELNKLKNKSSFSNGKKKYHRHFYYVKKALNFNEKLDAIDKGHPTFVHKDHFGRLKLLMNKQNEKNMKIIVDIRKEMIKSNDLLKVYVNKLINTHLGQKYNDKLIKLKI